MASTRISRPQMASQRLQARGCGILVWSPRGGKRSPEEAKMRQGYADEEVTRRSGGLRRNQTEPALRETDPEAIRPRRALTPTGGT